MHYLVYNLNTATAELLSPAELDEREQAAYARRGERYLRMRSLLKRELARLTGAPASAIRFTYTPNGKPEWKQQPFNLSHSGDMLCLAFHHRSIGVDIERIQPRPRLVAIARRMMCQEQYEAWQSRNCPIDEFYACWCAAEAITKQSGSSVWQAQKRPFIYRDGRIEPLYDGAPVVELIYPAEGYAGAIAYETTPQK